MKIPVTVLALGAIVLNDVVYFARKKSIARKAEARIGKHCAYGHVHLQDAIVYWCRVSELSKNVFQ